MSSKFSNPKRSILDIVEANWSFDEVQARQVIDYVRLPFELTDNEIPTHIWESDSDDKPAATLAWKLNNMAFALRRDERNQSMPHPIDIAGRLQKIASVADKLQDLVSDNDGQVLEALGTGKLFAFASRDHSDGGERAVKAVISGVAELSRWAKLAEERTRAEAKREPKRRGPPKDEAWHKLLERLSGTYWFLWKTRPDLSTDAFTANPGGPFFRFVCSVADVLLPDQRSETAIASAMRQHRW